MRGRVWLDRRTRGKPVWKIIYTGLDERTHWESTNATNRKEARELLVLKESELARAKAQGVSPEMLRPKLFAEFVDSEFLPHSKATNTLNTYRGDVSRVNNLKAHFGAMTLKQIGSGTVQKWFDSRAQEKSAKTERPLRPASVNKELMALSAIFREGLKRGYVDRNPVEGIKTLPPRNERVRWLALEEEGRLIVACAPHLRPIVLTALHTGMRLGEILRLRWADVDFQNRQIRVDFSKNHKPRFIPINDTLLGVLQGLAPSDASWGVSRPVFENGDTGKAFKDIGSAFEAACRRAGLTDFHFHDLRHCFGSKLVQAGRPLLEVAALLGHGSLKMSMRYAHLSPNNLRDAVAVLAKSGESVARALQNTPVRSAVQ